MNGRSNPDYTSGPAARHVLYVAPSGEPSDPSTGLADLAGVVVVTPDGIFRDGFNAGP